MQFNINEYGGSEFQTAAEAGEFGIRAKPESGETRFFRFPSAEKQQGFYRSGGGAALGMATGLIWDLTSISN